MAAAVSPDGKMIAASENTSENINSLVLIGTGKGEILKKIAAPLNASLQHPQWAEDGKKITVIFLTEDGEGIMSYEIDNGKWDVLLKAGRDDLQSSIIRNDSLFYISSKSGTDNIYLLTPGGISFQVSSCRFGATDLSIKGSSLFFSDYTSSGNDICKISLDEIPRNPEKPLRPVSYLSDRFEINKVNNYESSGKNYTPEPYRKWQHLFGLHSWMPFYADLEAVQANPASIRPGATIMSQNQLSTLTITAGYEYSEDERHLFHSKIAWKGWYPVFESDFSYGNEPLIYNARENGTAAPLPLKRDIGFQFRNTVSLPFSISTGRFSQFFYLAGISNFQNNYLYLNETSSYSSGMTQISGRFYFRNYSRMALRDLYPEWGQSLDLVYSWYPFESNYLGSALSAKSSFFFPGIFRDHSIRLRIEAEKQTSPYKYYRQGNRISFSRSYDDVSSNEAAFLSAEYTLPVFYPDFNISSLLYLKRIRAGLFYDYTTGTGNYVGIYEEGEYKIVFHDYNEDFKSFGVKLLSDFYLMRIPYMLSAGFETTFRSFDQLPYFRLLFNIDIYGMSIGKRMR